MTGDHSTAGRLRTGELWGGQWRAQFPREPRPRGPAYLSMAPAPGWMRGAAQGTPRAYGRLQWLWDQGI